MVICRSDFAPSAVHRIVQSGLGLHGPLAGGYNHYYHHHHHHFVTICPHFCLKKICHMIFFRAHCEGTGERQRRRAVVSPPGPGGFSCPPLLQQAVCPPCNPSPPSSSSRLPALSSQTPKRLPLTMALAGGDEGMMGQGAATVYVGPWSECQSRNQEKREPRDTRMREPGGGSTRVTLPRSLPPLPGQGPPASPHFPLPWLPSSSPAPSGPSSPAPVLGERQRNVVCRCAFMQQVHSFLKANFI